MGRASGSSGEWPPAAGRGQAHRTRGKVYKSTAAAAVAALPLLIRVYSSCSSTACYMPKKVSFSRLLYNLVYIYVSHHATISMSDNFRDAYSFAIIVQAGALSECAQLAICSSYRTYIRCITSRKRRRQQHHHHQYHQQSTMQRSTSRAQQGVHVSPLLGENYSCC